MSIATKTGDNGTTGLLFGCRVNKADHRIVAVGDIDELCAAIGLAKAWLQTNPRVVYRVELLTRIQRTLTLFMGEVACESSKRANYIEKYGHVTEDDLLQLDKTVEDLEKSPSTKQTDWIMYGDTEIGARFDFASKVCRRAERSFSNVAEQEQLANPLEYPRAVLARYINRLSDVLHLLARFYEKADFSTSAGNKIYRYE